MADLPEGIGPHEIAVKSWAAQEKILHHAREICAIVEADAPAGVGEWGPERIELAHALVNLEDTAGGESADWLRASTRYMEALVDLKKAAA